MSQPPSPSIVIYTDGGARGNPGPAAAAYLIYSPPGTLISQGGEYLGVKTNNEAEYQGIILALKALAPLSPPPQTQLSFYSDSLLIVNQLRGIYRIKEPRLAKLAADVRLILNTLFLKPEFIAIPRAQNSQADALVNQILDANPT